MGGLLPGVDVESQRPLILRTRGLMEYTHQRPESRIIALTKRILLRKQNGIL